MRDLVVLAGSSVRGLTTLICRNLTLEQSRADLRKFSNGEISIEIRDSVRGKDVFIVQSGCGHVNDNFVELLIMISACKSSSARRVTAVMPFFPYSRQPENPKVTMEHHESAAAPGLLASMSKTIVTNNAGIDFLGAVDENGRNASGYKQWVSQSGTVVANLLMTAGADRCITMDLHDPQFQGFFDIPVDNLYLTPLFKRYIVDYVLNYKDCVIVSPDSGGAKRAVAIADALGCSFALIHKERKIKVEPAVLGSPVLRASELQLSAGTCAVNTSMLVGDVKGRVCVLVDDLADTCATITSAALVLKDAGACYVVCLVTHGIFSGDALQKVLVSEIDRLVTTNSIPQAENIRVLGEKRHEVLDVSRIFAEAIRRINNGESVSMLFDHGW
ncbi:phosphoribosyl pyrophosphokinase [Metschnikowia bicuspidata]|uniref:ribose-phosphate diphosphokinase n=1 Tax=Metschnikowia bicuspidata TaxID=27322 RepID=A0A4P9ZBC1_9ASCO|nr:phosphoribosyl pyrophosphokinase [Metschnikowia bicuspidata]